MQTRHWNVDPRGRGGKQTFLCACVFLRVLFSVSFASAIEPLPESRRIPAAITETIAPDVNPGLHMPTDVAVDSTGNVYIADGARDRIVTVGADRKVRGATTQPAGEALKRPVGVTVDSKDQLWIADTDHHRILVLSPDQKLVEKIDLPKSESGRETEPTDLAVTPDGKRVYIIDNPNHRILIRDNATGQWSTMGRIGQRTGQLQYPFMVAIAGAGDVIITEAMNARAQILSAQDKWAGLIGSWGVELGQFFRPKGIAVDAKGRIFIGDSTLKVIQVFDPRGRNIGALTGGDGRPLKFEHPMGMCFDKAGRLYVTELRANRIAVVTIKEGATP